MLAEVTIRSFRPDDIDALMALFQRAVREIASRDYSPKQIAAWSQARTDRDGWLARRLAKPTFIAERAGEIAGFSDLESDGHIDMLFVSPDHQRQGVATRLINHVIGNAREQGLRAVYTEASITARPVFERCGFHVVAAQQVTLHGQTLTNYRMRRELEAESTPA